MASPQPDSAPSTATDGKSTQSMLGGLNLSKGQTTMLSLFKKELGISENQPQDSGVKDDVTLYRFLSGKKWDFTIAKEQYEAMIKWREEEKVDEIFVWGERNKERISLSTDIHPRAHYGFDKDGRPLWINRIGALDAKKYLAQFTGDESAKIHIWNFESLQQICREQQKKLGKPIYSATIIIDAAGISLSHRHLLGLFKINAAIDKQNYPEFVHKVYVVNCPWVTALLFNLSKPFIDPSTREKITMVSGPTCEALQDLVGAEELPIPYGGKCKRPLPEKKVDTKSEASEDLEMTNIPARQIRTLENKCTEEKGGRFTWILKCVSRDITVRIKWCPDDEKQASKIVVDAQRVIDHEGSFAVDGLGTLLITFDNSFSYFTSKDVRFAVIFHPSEEK